MHGKSAQPRKKRKALFNLPLHRRKLGLTATLSPKLRSKFGRRSLPVRIGDKVKVLRGEFAGMQGKIREIVFPRIKIEGVKRKKVDGTEVHVPVHTSNVMVLDAEMGDPKRRKIIERSGGKVEVKKEVKPRVRKAKEVKKPKAVFKCPVCKREFKDKGALDIHIGKRHKEYKR